MCSIGVPRSVVSVPPQATRQASVAHVSHNEVPAPTNKCSDATAPRYSESYDTVKPSHFSLYEDDLRSFFWSKQVPRLKSVTSAWPVQSRTILLPQPPAIRGSPPMTAWASLRIDSLTLLLVAAISCAGAWDRRQAGATTSVSCCRGFLLVGSSSSSSGCLRPKRPTPTTPCSMAPAALDGGSTANVGITPTS